MDVTLNPNPAEKVMVVVDGGGTKTAAAVINGAGEVLARKQNGRYYPQEIGAEAAAKALNDLVTGMLADIGNPTVALAAVYFSGLDFDFEIDALRAALAAYPWASRELLVDNDLFPVLRVGTDSPNAVAVICGTGSNAVGRSAAGEVVRYAAIGDISGDWGGGDSLGMTAVWHAARAEDGRGPHTALHPLVLQELGFDSMAALIEAFHRGDLSWSTLSTLAPLVFQAADQGDEVAADLVQRQADEIVAFAVATIRRLNLLDEPCPVVLAGGVVTAQNPRLLDAIRTGLADQAPKATIQLVTAPPVLGSALLALDAIGAADSAKAKVTAQLA